MRDQLADEVALLVGLRRLGRELKRYPAHGAHDLVLDVGEGGLRLRLLRGRRRGNRERTDEREQDCRAAHHR
jgi:hypothetical protein